MKKWIIIVISVLVVGFVGYQWYSANHSSSTQDATSQTRTATVQQGKLQVKVSGSGTVQPVTSEDIKSTIDNNEIDEVLVSAGESVTEGEELVTFTDDSDPITAPADGVITSISVSEGGRVTTGEVVAHLTDYSDLETVVAVDETDITKVKTGQTADITVSAYSDKTFTGKVTEVANEGSSSNGTSTFDVTVHIENPGNLKVGMSTEASILTNSKDSAIYVPVDAVYTSNDQKYVIVTSTSGTQQVTVKTGIANDEYVEITDGVSVGTTVQLPQLSSSSSSSSSQNQMRGMDNMSGGGMMPSGGAPTGKGGE